MTFFIHLAVQKVTFIFLFLRKTTLTNFLKKEKNKLFIKNIFNYKDIRFYEKKPLKKEIEIKNCFYNKDKILKIQIE